MASPIAALKLLQQLLKRTSRQDKNFDKYQRSFLKKLQNSSSSKTTEALFEECLMQLSEYQDISDITRFGSSMWYILDAVHAPSCCYE